MDDDVVGRQARGLWTLYEAVHAVAYFAPQVAVAYEAVGVRGFWRGYFAGRAAPLTVGGGGPVGPAPVVALFGGFAPAMVERALPSVWELVSPAVALDARAVGAAAAIRAVVGAGADAGGGAAVVGDAEVSAAVDALEAVVSDLPTVGRALAAGNAALPPRDDLYERLWQATTTVREWRGDAHIAACVVHGLAGLDVVVLRCLLDLDRAHVQRVRGWTDEQWALATARLESRGLVADGGLTAAAHDVLADVERATDAASVVGDPDGVRALGRLLHPIAVACAALLPFPNPIGVVRPWDPAADPDAELVARV